jgi:hypothetical protein
MQSNKSKWKFILILLIILKIIQSYTNLNFVKINYNIKKKVKNINNYII